MRVGLFATQKDAVIVGPEHTLAEAARRIQERRVGSAVVISEGEDPGIITERDVLRAIAEGADPTTARVGAYMTHRAVTVSPDWHVLDAARTMVERGFRHLIMVDSSGEIVGILSMRDMLRALLEDRQGMLAG